jgi:formylmethanofuran dehydrogenase subunit B
MTPPATIENVTCLGCGCACDDIGVTVDRGIIVGLRNACALGATWFGDGAAPSRCTVEGRDASVDQALQVASALLLSAKRPLVYVAPGLASEAQRDAVALADILRARLETATSAASHFVLATQERGLATATFGEIRNRADVVVFWAVDVAARYPRFTSRYAPEPAAMHVSGARRVIAVDVGAATSSVHADPRIVLHPNDEVATLTALTALARGGHAFDEITAARDLWPVISAGRYIAFVFDAELDDRDARSETRFDALIALTQALNDTRRCAAIALRGGGNRSGTDSVLVAQTGYPFAVDFARGFPRYDPHGTWAAADAALVVGDAAMIPEVARRDLHRMASVVIGPRASTAALGAAAVSIDTGIDGIHSGGTAARADDVPLPLRASVPGPLTAGDVIRSLATLVSRRR